MWPLTTKNVLLFYLHGFCLRPDGVHFYPNCDYPLLLGFPHSTLVPHCIASSKGRVTFQPHRSEAITSLVKVIDGLITIVNPTSVQALIPQALYYYIILSIYSVSDIFLYLAQFFWVKPSCFKAQFSRLPPQVFFLYVSMCESLHPFPQIFSILCGTVPGTVPSSSNDENK